MATTIELPHSLELQFLKFQLLLIPHDSVVFVTLTKVHLFLVAKLIDLFPKYLSHAQPIFYKNQVSRLILDFLVP